MLNKLFTKPIELAIGEQTLKFSSLAEYEFGLSGRTSVPAKKIISMVKFSLEELKKEAKAIKKIERQFIDVLSESIEKPANINRLLREMDPHIFSQDHGWRTIIAALYEDNEELNEFKRVALIKYMQYLSSRQDIIKYLYVEKKKYMDLSTLESTNSGEKFKDTLILENVLLDPASDKQDDGMERMPKGENIAIRMQAGKEVNLRLSQHKCKLVGEESVIKFIDKTGRSYPLKTGKNAIGRNSDNDVVIDPSLRDVSRIHIMIETDDANTLYLTDISAHGTYLPAEYIENRTF